MDYSGWISSQLEAGDYAALWFFVKAYLGNTRPDENTPVSFSLEDVLTKSYASASGMDLLAARNELRRRTQENERNLKNESVPLEITFNKFLQKDFKSFIDIGDKGILDIQSFFIINAGMGSILREFWIAKGKQAHSLAKVLSVYTFNTNRGNFAGLMKTANAFLKSMKKDKMTDFWNEYPYYVVSDIDESYQPNVKTDILIKLQALGIGERLHFFDFASGFSGQYWAGDSSFKTRRTGVIEKASLKKMIGLGLFTTTNDLASIPAVASKAELIDKATKAGFELKKSWDFRKIHAFLLSTDNGADLLAQIVAEKGPVKFNSLYKDDIAEILAYQEKILPVAELLAMI